MALLTKNEGMNADEIRHYKAAQMRRWRAAHPEKVKARNKKRKSPEARARANELNRTLRNNNLAASRAKALSYYYKNRDKCMSRHRKYVSANREQLRNYSREYEAKNKEARNAKCRQYDKTNRAKITQKHVNRYRINPSVRIRHCLRNRISKALSGVNKSKTTMQLLGCSIEDFWIYLESKFESGMSRENYGKIWEVDHIMPIAIFDLSKPDHQRRCFHFSNLQPLFVKDNRIKKAKIINPQFNLI